VKRLSDWAAERADRHATALLHDSAGCRLVAFTLAADQEVKVHTSSSTVLCIVVSGEGTFLGADGAVKLEPGASVEYAPEEPHGMVAGAAGLRFLAVITPGPSAVPS
jgi:quercetin dioxygenase-like cupin family protein